MLKTHGHKIILGLCLIFIIVLFLAINKSQSSDNLSDVINMYSVGIGSIAMLYTGLVTAYMSYMSNNNIMEQKVTDSQNKEKERIYDQNKNTQMLLLKFDDGVIYKARQFTREITTAELGTDLILSRITADTEEGKALKDSVIMLFNYFDHIRIAIKMDIVNKEIIIDALGETIIEICGKFDKWVKTKPNTKKDVDKLLSYLNKS